jgi:hypothetical protein
VSEVLSNLSGARTSGVGRGNFQMIRGRQCALGSRKPQCACGTRM